MASTSSTVYATSPVLGVDLDSKSSTPAHKLLTPVFAGAAMALSSVSVVTNALRLKRFHLKDKAQERLG